MTTDSYVSPVQAPKRTGSMDDGALKAVIQSKIQNAIGYQGGQLAQLRMQAERYYKGDKFGNEVPGRSQVVSRDVAEAVDSMMPSLMKIFTSGDEVVRFEPTAKQFPENATPEDKMAAIKRAEKQAKEQTQYVNWIWHVQNPGFLTTYAWFKSALMKKTGVVKIWWDTKITTTRETYERLTDEEFATLLSDDDVELIEHYEYPDPSAGAAASPPLPPAPPAGGEGAPVNPPLQLPMLHNCVVRQTNRDGRTKIQAVPEDEFLIDRRAISLDETPFCAHRFKSTITELVEMFPEKEETIRELPTGEEAEYGMERLERFKDEDKLPWRQDNPADPSMREVWVTECYLKVDFDGDGIAELRKTTVAGDTGYVILDNEETDSHPFAALTPIIMPHKFYGMSIADQTIDIQLIKSTLWRGMLDHLYNSVSPQVGVVEGQANMDDLLNRRAGGVVRIKNPNALVPIPNPPLGIEPASMIEYMDSVREARTGVRRFTSGLNSDTLNKNAYSDTATGATLVNDASAERLELIARVFAETGFRDAMKKIFELVCKHQRRPKMIRLSGQWVTMDPREWTDQMDLTISVGLGTGSRQQQLQAIGFMLQAQQQIITLQQGISGPIVTGENLYNTLEKFVQFSGFRSAAPFFTDPSKAPQMGQQQQKTDPTIQAAQIKAQQDAQELQVKTQLEQKKHQDSMGLEMQKIQANERVAQADLMIKREIEWAKLAAAREEFNAEATLRMREHETDLALRNRELTHTELSSANDMALRRQESAGRTDLENRKLAHTQKASDRDDQFRKNTTQGYPRPNVIRVRALHGPDNRMTGIERHFDDGTSNVVPIERASA